MEETFGVRIRRARQARRMSQRVLARLIGITPPALNQIELGKSAVFAHRVRDIARILDVDARFLLGLCETMEEVDYHKLGLTLAGD